MARTKLQLPSTRRSLPIALMRSREQVMAPIRAMLRASGLTEQQWRVHGYKKLPAPFMMEEQHRMVTWFESLFMPFPELIVSLVIFIEIFGGIGIILGGLIGLFATQAGHFITRLSGFALFVLMINIFYFGHPDWFVWPPIKLLTSEQIFLFVLSIYFMVRGNK